MSGNILSFNLTTPPRLTILALTIRVGFDFLLRVGRLLVGHERLLLLDSVEKLGTHSLASVLRGRPTLVEVVIVDPGSI